MEDKSSLAAEILSIYDMNCLETIRIMCKFEVAI